MIVDVEFEENSQSFNAGFEEGGNNFLPGFGEIHVVGGEKGKSAYEIAVDNGFEGTEEEWLASLHGKDGQDGVDGKDGKSAYQIAVDESFDGSEAEWLASLQGKDGQDGVDGKDGKSAYQIAVDEGFDGSESEWLASLHGKDGRDGIDGKDGKSAYQIAVDEGFDGSEAEWLASLQGKDGQDGVDGKDGNSAYQIAVDEGFEGSEAEWLASLQGKDGGVSDVQINGESIVDENGLAAIPVVTNAKGGIGLVRVGNLANGQIGVRNINGNISLAYPEASVNGFNLRKVQGSQYSGVVSSSNFDLAVKLAMTDGVGAAWTEDEQASARLRMGAVSLEDVLSNLPVYGGEVEDV